MGRRVFRVPADSRHPHGSVPGRHNAVTLLFAAGLVEEDARFGLLFEALDCLQSRRPTVGVLAEVWDASDGGDARALASQLRRLGLLHVANPDAPRAEWALQVPTAVWDAVRGERSHHPVNWARYQPPAALPELQDLIVTDALRAPLGAIPALLRSGDSRALVLRGPRHNGRHTVLGAVARALGRGVLEIAGFQARR